jgi:A/G-specific adenine glycosylase
LAAKVRARAAVVVPPVKTEVAGPGGAFAERVVSWQRRHGRHDLPWQNTRDAYRIWVSEIMLQQTQVSAVVGYYARFLAACPDVASLAAADASEVMRLWSGLGYYSRARNLHRAARIIVGDFGGRFPGRQEELQALPGIGRSTAAAIAAFAFGARAAILDGNVKRLFARHFGVDGYPGTPTVEASMWRLAEEVLPAAGIEAYTQGLMDLGATLCVRSRPRCDACPLASTCIAHATGRTAELPQPKPRKALPHRSCVMLVLHAAGRVLLERRPPAGIWGGLLSLPQADDLEQACKLAGHLGGDWAGMTRLTPIEHGFTHYRLTILPVVTGLLPGRQLVEVRESDRVWLALDEAPAAGVPAPVKRLLAALRLPGLFA